jgi:hypothetical protein
MTLRELLASRGAEIVTNGGSPAAGGGGSHGARKRPDDPSLWAASPEHVVALLQAWPNDGVSLPTHDDFVRVLAAIKAALGPRREEFFGEVEEWALAYPGNDANYVCKTWDSLVDTAIGWDWLVGVAGHGSAAAQDEFDDGVGEANFAAAPTPPKPPPTKAATVLYADDLKRAPEPSDFIENTLCDNQISVVVGDTNVGKSFFALDLAYCVATGADFNGRKVDRGAVLFVAGEGGGGMKYRVAAIEQKFPADARIGFVPHAISLRDRLETDRLIAAVKASEARLGDRVRLIIIDTLSRAMAGGNENSPDDMGALVTSADRVRTETGAHVLFIAHTGKDATKGIRGHSLLRAAIDTEIIVERGENGIIEARVTKQRDLEIAGVFTFKLKTVELGTNRRGKPITSCVVEVVAKSRPALSETEGEAVEILRQLLFESAGATVPLVDFRKSILSSAGLLTGRTPDTKLKQWQRLRGELVKRGIIEVSGDQVSLRNA